MNLAVNQFSNPVHNSTDIQYSPEDNPYHTVFIDLTHRCNMECKNCYIPNRDIPDMDTEWLYKILARFTRRTRIRLSGGEPTVRKDLAEIIRRIRQMGHTPTVLSNGLKFANRSYVQKLKKAGLRTVHISFNGGLDNDLYEKIDDLRCAQRKLTALQTLVDENMNVTTGMILVRGINDHHLKAFYQHVKTFPQVRDFHIRSVGAFGRYMDIPSLSMSEMKLLFCDAAGITESDISISSRGDGYIDFICDGKHIQITQWPDLNTEERGRLTPEGMIEPFFEHIIANEGGY